MSGENITVSQIYHSNYRLQFVRIMTPRILHLVIGISLLSLHGTNSGAVQEACAFEDFKAKCGTNEVIVIDTAEYGRMRLGRCVRKDLGFVGCTSNVLDEVDRFCSGRRQCVLDVGDIGALLVGRLPCLEELKSYLEVSYSCMREPASESCQSSRAVLIREPVGVIPSTLTFETQCGSPSSPWVIEVESGQKVNITLHDYTKGYASDGTTFPGVCYAYASIKEEGRHEVKTICGGRKRVRHVYTSLSNRVEIRVMNGGGENERQQYFVLHYAAISCTDPELGPQYKISRNDNEATITCLTTEQTWKLVCKENVWAGTIGNCSIGNPATGSSTGSFNFMLGPFALTTELSIILVIAIACVIGSCILMAGLCYVKRQREVDTERAEQARSKDYQTRTNSTYKTSTLSPPPPPNGDTYKYPPPSYGRHYSDQQGGNEYASILDTPLPIPPDETGSVPSLPSCPHAFGTDASGRCRYCHSSDSGYSERDPRYFELDPDIDTH